MAGQHEYTYFDRIRAEAAQVRLQSMQSQRHCHDLQSANLQAMNTLLGTIQQMRELLLLTRQAREELTYMREQRPLPLSTKPN